VVWQFEKYTTPLHQAALDEVVRHRRQEQQQPLSGIGCCRWFDDEAGFARGRFIRSE
jgi:hypothetical protein